MSREKAVRLKEREKGRENAEQKGGVLPEEMMKPKNDCQTDREGDGEQKMAGRKERQIIIKLMANEWKLCRGLPTIGGSGYEIINGWMKGKRYRQKKCQIGRRRRKKRRKRPAGKEKESADCMVV